jgi:2-phosphoglycerate kinase
MVDTTALALSPSEFLILESSTGLTPGFTRMILSRSVTSVTVGESPARQMARGVV